MFWDYDWSDSRKATKATFDRKVVMADGSYFWTDTILRTTFPLGAEYDGHGKDRRNDPGWGKTHDVDGLEITTHIHELVTRLWPRNLALSKREPARKRKAEKQARGGLERVDVRNPGARRP